MKLQPATETCTSPNTLAWTVSQKKSYSWSSVDRFFNFPKIQRQHMLSEVDLTKICCFAFDLIETALELNQTRDYDIFASLGGQKNVFWALFIHSFTCDLNARDELWFELLLRKWLDLWLETCWLAWLVIWLGIRQVTWFVTWNILTCLTCDLICDLLNS